jgi:hypothetical protein
LENVSPPRYLNSILILNAFLRELGHMADQDSDMNPVCWQIVKQIWELARFSSVGPFLMGSLFDLWWGDDCPKGLRESS